MLADKEYEKRIKKKRHFFVSLLYLGGEQGIRTLEQGLTRYTISNRAPSTSSDNSPDDEHYYIQLIIKNQVFILKNLKRTRFFQKFVD